MIFKSSVTGRTSKNKEKNSAREAFASGNYALSLTNSRGLDKELFYMSQILYFFSDGIICNLQLCSSGFACGGS